LHDKLAGAGVAIVTPLFEGPFGLTFAFEDPDGYVITIHG
jgi:predicted enzyme related to lactoylglutathione lyase